MKTPVDRRPVTCECGNHAWIKLTKGYCALISAEDTDLLAQNTWTAFCGAGGKVYAARKAWVAGTGKADTVLLHRVVAAPPAGMVVDHINRDTLDNRRLNLRTCLQAQNTKSRIGSRRSGSSSFKGVCFDKQTGRWRASIAPNRTTINIGRFDTQEDAARAYDKAALLHFGEFALTNRKLGLLP